MPEKIMVALSGGVDSAAACLPHSGHARIPSYPHEYMRHINKKYILYSEIK